MGMPSAWALNVVHATDNAMLPRTTCYPHIVLHSTPCAAHPTRSPEQPALCHPTHTYMCAHAAPHATTISAHATSLILLPMQYRDERDLPIVMSLVDSELSEPYSIFTYRYFLQQWPQLCFIAYDGDK